VFGQTGTYSHHAQGGAYRQFPYQRPGNLRCEKAQELGAKYQVQGTFTYEECPTSLGMIPAGYPSDQEQHSDRCVSIDEDTLQLPKNARTFALEVRGNSMIDAHIVEGDVVIMELRDPAHRDIVAALIDGETTLKRFLVHKGKPFLRAENSKYTDLIPARNLRLRDRREQGIRSSLGSSD
jgi:SOS-response transcriptional repressor LexA